MFLMIDKNMPIHKKDKRTSKCIWNM